MEELNLDFSLGELEAIEKNISLFTYPVVHFGALVTFNARAGKAGIIGEAIKWFVTPEYVIGLKAKKCSENAYAVRKNAANFNCSSAAFPVKLKEEKKLQSGYYKLLKYKDGFAFKRYEPIEME